MITGALGQAVILQDLDWQREWGWETLGLGGGSGKDIQSQSWRWGLEQGVMILRIWSFWTVGSPLPPLEGHGTHSTMFRDQDPPASLGMGERELKKE